MKRRTAISHQQRPELRDYSRCGAFRPRLGAVLDPLASDPDKLEQLEAVKRWFNDDWKRIEPKLRTSIVEGFPSFFHFSTTTRK